MDWSLYRSRAEALRRNLEKQQDLIIELLAQPDTTMQQIEQARQYARNMRETQQQLNEIEAKHK
jgi:hypothetical protein